MTQPVKMIKATGRLRPVGLLLVLLTTMGCGLFGSAKPVQPGKPARPGTETRLRIGDQIQVRLETGGQVGDRTQSFDLIVDERGEIALPLIGQLSAAGKTTSELSESVQSRYVPRFYVRCSALVMTAQRFFYVGGEVRSPGRFPWTEDITLLKAINTAGGFTDYANRSKVEVIRESAKDAYDYEAMRRNPAKDVPIHPGESVWVARSIF
jgi:polysaccharide export outer membrane protein